MLFSASKWEINSFCFNKNDRTPSNNQFYDQLPARISKYLHHRYGFLKCIDVGANIGDSVAAFYKDEKDSFLAIEPNKKFYWYLLANWGSHENVVTRSCICSSNSGVGMYQITESHGTASVVESETGNRIETTSLDDLIADISSFGDFNILKIDTDGHDFKVIAGAMNIISTNLPLILFECDEFSNSNYVEECLMTLDALRDVGYNSFLLYDNWGYLMGQYSLADLSCFRNLLFYQLTSSFDYFEILLMNDEDIIQFSRLESAFFVDKMINKSLQQTAKVAGEF